MTKRMIYLLFLICLWLGGLSVTVVVMSALISIFLFYIIIPLVYHFSPSLQSHLVFLAFVQFPKKVNFYEPENEGLPGTRNLYIETEPDIKVGVWHILPKSLIDKCPAKGSPNYDTWYEESLSDGRPVVLYVHGNTSSRAIAHRVELYNILRGLDYHVIAFDYRGYADSTTAHLNETGVVHDAKVVYKHFKAFTGNSPVIIWGHSLGTGVSCHAVALLCQEGNSPAGLILESPFNNIKDEVMYHPLASIFKDMPKFDWFFLSPLKETGLDFRSDDHIAHIDIPVVILHAEDDLVVPFMLGKKLYETSQKVRPKNFPEVKFIPFEKDHGFGHKYICRSPEVPYILKNFVSEIQAKQKVA